MNSMPLPLIPKRPLDLRHPADAKLLEDLGEAQNSRLKGRARYDYLLKRGWKFVGYRNDNRGTSDWYHPGYRNKWGMPITYTASQAIRFQVYLNLVSAGLIKGRVMADLSLLSKQG